MFVANGEALDMSDDASSYIVSDFEGLSSTFSEMVELPSTGYCRLYKAKRYGRWFLLKCLKQELSSDTAYQQLLRKEFEIMMRLQHPSIMQAIGMEDVLMADGHYERCLIAEWIDGETLAQYLEANPNRSDRQRIAIDLAEALAYIHHQQVVHRDLKPSNIMITYNGSYVKIIDFGLADTDSHAILKQPAGTLKYMAPEQATKALPDVRNDIYSLGVILLEMDIYKKVAERCLRPIHQRYQNMDNLLAALHQQRKWHFKLMASAMIALVVIFALIAKVNAISHKASDLEKHTAELNLQVKVLNHEIIGFEDPEAKQKCISHWDYDHDGELSYQEAASVKSLGDVFTKDTLLRSFPELEHFTGLNEIDACAFWDCTHLESIRIPRTVRFIRQSAFRHTGLQMITIPSSVVAIGDHILEDCPELETVIFESVLPNTNDGAHHLVDCPKLSAIFVPEFYMTETNEKKSWQSLKPYIHKYIEFRDPAVKSVCVSHWDRNGDGELSIDESMAVTSLGGAFSGNTAIRSFDELRYFTGLKEIEASAFELCNNLKSVQLPRSVGTLGENAFLECDFSEFYIPSGVTHIASTALGANHHLCKIEISADNPVYDSREDCNAIIEKATNQMVTGSATAIIPNSVTSLSDECFNWFNRDELVIPSQLTHIGTWALTCLFQRIYCMSDVPPFYRPDTRESFWEHLPEIYIPYGSTEAYCHAEGWKLLTHRLHEFPAKPAPVSIDFSYFFKTWTNLDQLSFLNFD